MDRASSLGRDQLVSVVVPAYNAAATLDETLRSVRAQTHRALDIIVVDDGSSDATGSIAGQHARDDTRVRVLQQANAGVAAARNRGWRDARSELVAFIDADDLWAARKIELQLGALHAAGPRTGLVYCWYAHLDAESRVIDVYEGPRWQGDVLQTLAATSFIGNGSAALIRREALEGAGGFDASLQARGAQGCEDQLLYCRIAASYHFAVVAEHLVGYRTSPGRMSSDRVRMLRSWQLVAQDLRARYPGRLDAALDAGLRDYARWLLRDAVEAGSGGAVLQLLFRLGREQPGATFEAAWELVLRPRLVAVKHRLRAPPPMPRRVLDARLGHTFDSGDLPR